MTYTDLQIFKEHIVIPGIYILSIHSYTVPLIEHGLQKQTWELCNVETSSMKARHLWPPTVEYVFIVYGHIRAALHRNDLPLQLLTDQNAPALSVCTSGPSCCLDTFLNL